MRVCVRACVLVIPTWVYAQACECACVYVYVRVYACARVRAFERVSACVHTCMSMQCRALSVVVVTVSGICHRQW